MTFRRGGDPYWLRAKYASKCECGTQVNKGDQGFYYPNGRKMLCLTCGKNAEQDFNAHKFDEAQISGRW